MRAPDLPAMIALGRIVHPGFPEDEDVLAERLHLHPAGCYVHMTANTLTGYLISHPWHEFSAPPLNRKLAILPAAPTTYYLHDLALHPSIQGTGAASRILRHLIASAAGGPGMSLVAVNNSAGFWRRHGFSDAGAREHAARPEDYGHGARFMTRP